MMVMTAPNRAMLLALPNRSNRDISESLRVAGIAKVEKLPINA